MGMAHGRTPRGLAMKFGDREHLIACVRDIISALDVAELPRSIQVGKDFIYPSVAMERAQVVLSALQAETR